MSRRTRAALATAALLVVTPVGCATDGTTLREPKPGAVAPPPPTDSTSASNDDQVAVSLMALTSPSFSQRGSIPSEYTCDGANVSPPLQWTGVPPEAQELAITVTDSDFDDYVHWVVTGLPPTLSAIGRGAAPEGAVQTQNDSGIVGWTGPCPPAGTTHDYTFTLYALNAPSGVTTETDPHTAIDMIGQVPGEAATLIGAYQRH